MSIIIIDYGLSNLLSVERAFRKLGEDAQISSNPEALLRADKLVLPGVGAFGDGMNGLNNLGLADVIKEKTSAGTPLLGICLGMQMLFDESDEFGVHKGLGLIPGRVEKIPDYDIDGQQQHIPHIGWNHLYPCKGEDFSGSILSSVTPGQETYFVHSFEAKPANGSDRLADTIYGGRRISATVQRGSVIGCQFHPEKSGPVGLGILTQFIGL